MRLVLLLLLAPLVGPDAPVNSPPAATGVESAVPAGDHRLAHAPADALETRARSARAAVLRRLVRKRETAAPEAPAAIRDRVDPSVVLMAHDLERRGRVRARVRRSSDPHLVVALRLALAGASSYRLHTPPPPTPA